MKPIVYKGKTFVSYRQAAKFIDISAMGFSKRYKKYQSGQCTLEELFSTDKHDANKKSLTYHGKTFTSYQEAAQAIGISNTTFYRRLKKYHDHQITLDELFLSAHYRDYKLPPFHKKVFENETDAANYVGISLNRFSQRLKKYDKGLYTVDDLYSRNSSYLRAKNLKTIKLHYQGKTFNSYKAAYDYIGISSSAFQSRLKKYLNGEFTIEQLFRSPKHSQGKMIKYHRQTFYSYTEAASFIGISLSGFHKRLQKYASKDITLDELFQPKLPKDK